MSTAIQTLSFQDPLSAKKFTESLQHTGFAIITHCPIDPQLLDRVYHNWALFFNSDEKHQYPFDPLTADGFASTAVSETAKGFQEKDLKEFYHILREGRCPEHLKEDTFALIDALLPISQTLLAWIQASLPTEIEQALEQTLPSMAQNSPNTKLRMVHYPPLLDEATSGAVRAAAHEDINLITLLPAATAKGLQAKNLNGGWVDVNCPDRALIINAGDMLAECTQNFIRSTTHRVINPIGDDAKQSRMSMPLFVHPHNDVRLSDRHTAISYRLQRYQENGFNVPANQTP
jgi:isopenicillin N synthase-like dioxygenase